MFATGVEDKCVKEKWLVHLCILLLCSVEDGKQKTVALWKIGFYGIFVMGTFVGEVLLQGGIYMKKQYLPLWEVFRVFFSL